MRKTQIIHTPKAIYSMTKISLQGGEEQQPL
jgi:hypothetical protein